MEKKQDKLPDLLNVRALAGYLDISPFTVVKKAEKGEIPGFKVGNLWRFRTDEINLWIQHQGQKTRKKTQLRNGHS